jgi:2'-5' RNA ligase
VGIRAFLGIELTPDVRQTLTLCCDAMRHASVPWRAEKWVAEQNFHVTLKFLGTVPETALPEIERAASRACEQTGEYPLTLGAVTAVPRLRAASMLWGTASDGAEETRALAAELERRLSAVGFARSDTPFKTHITLVRARRPREISFDALDVANRLLFAADERETRMSVRGITLYSSTLTPRGPVYEELSFIPLPGD